MAEGYTLVDIRNAKCCISFVGLNEFVMLAKNNPILRGGAGYRFALDFLNLLWKLSREIGLFPDMIEIEENPELVAAYRLARRDCDQFEMAREFFNNKTPQEVCYSNGFNLNNEEEALMETHLDFQKRFHKHLGLIEPIVKSQGTGYSWQQIYNLL